MYTHLAFARLDACTCCALHCIILLIMLNHCLQIACSLYAPAASGNVSQCCWCRVHIFARCLQAEHLSHWGINMMAMQKTEKTMAEAEIEANKDFEWSHITESGKQLMPKSGPG